MEMIKYLADPDTYTEPNEIIDYVINHESSKLMSLKEFQNKFNDGEINEHGLIAIVPPISYNKTKKK